MFSGSIVALVTPMQAEDRVQNARASIESDPNVRAMREIFGATVTPDSVRPNDN